MSAPKIHTNRTVRCGKSIDLRVHDQSAKSIEIAHRSLAELVSLRIAALLHSHKDTKISTLGHIAQEVERDDVLRENKHVALECNVQKVECHNPVRTILVVEDSGIAVSVCYSGACDSVG